MRRTLPESPEHERIKSLVTAELNKLPEIKSVGEYSVAGHRADVYGLTTDGIKTCFEIIWSDNKAHFETDLKAIHQDDAHIKIVIASPKVLAREDFRREFDIAVMTERGKEVVMYAEMLDGKKIIDDPQYLGTVNQIVLNGVAEVRNRITSQKPVLTLEEFKQREYVKPLLKFTKFIGRNKELEALKGFLNSSEEKVKIIIGSGGVGKTRLVIEFAEQSRNLGLGWNIFFINQYRDFRPITLKGKTLLILDDSSGCSDRRKIIDFALHPAYSGGNEIKLLLVDRPIFRESIEMELSQEFVDATRAIINIESGNISEFSAQNLEIGEDVAKEIEKLSEGNFLYAILYGESYKEGGKILQLERILAERVDKYITDLASEIRLRAEDIKHVLYLLSLVAPIEWQQDQYAFETELLQSEYECLTKVLQAASRYNTGIIAYDKAYRVYPDPFGDYMRYRFMKEKDFEDYLHRFLPYMPERISYNISITVVRFDPQIAWDANTLLGEMWENLNGAVPCEKITPEYFVSLMTFTGLLTVLPFFDIEKANVDKWIKCCEDVGRRFRHRETELRGDLARALFNCAFYCEKRNKLDKAENFLGKLRKVYNESKEKEVLIELASALTNLTFFYGSSNKPEKMVGCLDELRSLHREKNDRDVGRKLAGALNNVADYNGRVGNLERAEDIVKELDSLYEENKEKETRAVLARALVNIASDFGKICNFAKMEGFLNEIKKLTQRYPERDMREKYFAALANSAAFYGVTKRFDKVEASIEELVKAYQEDKETIVTEQLVKALFNAVYLVELGGGKLRYDYILLAFKLRYGLLELTYSTFSSQDSQVRYGLPIPGYYDMSKRQRTQTIEVINKAVRDRTVAEIKGAYEMGKHKLEELKTMIRAILDDDASLAILLSIVSEKLPIEIQGIIWRDTM